MNEQLQLFFNKIWFKVMEWISYTGTVSVSTYDLVVTGTLNSFLIAVFSVLSITFLLMRMYHQFLQTMLLKQKAQTEKINKKESSPDDNNQ